MNRLPLRRRARLGGDLVLCADLLDEGFDAAATVVLGEQIGDAIGVRVDTLPFPRGDVPGDDPPRDGVAGNHRPDSIEDC